MFCPNCGFPFEGTPKFCPQCGAMLQNNAPQMNQSAEQPSAPTQKIPYAPQTAAYSTEAQNTVPPQPNPYGQQSPVFTGFNAQNQFEQTPPQAYAPFQVEEPKQNKKFYKKPKFWIITAVVVLLAALSVFLLSGNFFTKLFKSDVEYTQYVHKNAVEDFSDDFSEFYSELKQSISSSEGDGGQATAGVLHLDVEVGQKLISLISRYTEMDLSWVKNASVVYKVNTKDGKYLFDVTLQFNNTDIISAEIIMDTVDTKTIYITSKELFDKYISIPLPDEFMTQTDPMAVAKILQLLPDTKVMEKLINRYADVALSQIKQVDKIDDVIEIGSLKVTYEKYTVNVDKTLITNIVKAVLREAKNDKDLKDLVKSFMADNPYANETEIMNEFDKAIDEALAEIDSDFENEVAFNYSFWVDGEGELAGFEIVMGGDGISYVSIEKGKKSAVEFKIIAGYADNITYSGEGVTSGGKKNGKYSLKVRGIEFLTVSLIDYDEESGNSGTFEIAPSPFITNMLASSLAGQPVPQELTSIISDGIKFRIDYSFSKKGGSFGISILSGNDKLISVSEKVETTSPSNVQVPTSSIPADNVETPEDLGIDIEKIINLLSAKFQQAGIPQEILALLASLVEVNA